MLYSYDLVMTIRSFSVAFLFLLLGCGGTENPQHLLEKASNYAGPTGLAGEQLSKPTDEARLEALRILLRLQSRIFDVKLDPITTTSGIDHLFIATLRST